MPRFTQDVDRLRERALRKIEEGAVTAGYKGNVENTIQVLNDALATEIVCVLRYMHHYFMATGVHGRSIADEFKEHADAEREHADAIAARIQQLGGKPDFNPRSLLQRSASQYVEGETLAQMIREDLVAERIVIEVYQEMIRYFADNDPTTRVMLEGILADEEDHANDLADLLYIQDPRTGETEGKDPGTDPLRLAREQREGRTNGGAPPAGERSSREASRRNRGGQAQGHHREERQQRRERPRDNFLQKPESSRMGASQRNRYARGQAASEPNTPPPLTPDFITGSKPATAPQASGGGWRPGEKSQTAGEFAEKRHESVTAGPPGAPEFSAAAAKSGENEKRPAAQRSSRRNRRFRRNRAA